MAITPGSKLGRYKLTARIGTGGMSEVWRAEDETLHRQVAVKVMHDPIAQSEEFVERFLREARLVAGLEHMHILPVYDFGTTEVEGKQLSYLVMPLVAGSLKDKMKGPVPPAQAIPWLMAVAQALDHSHSKGVMHRDIKPANVLMDSNGRLLLADFGLARNMSSVSGLTATGAVMGTPWYMAPEQATGKQVGPPADQYALAVTAFQMLSGEMPFHADSPLGVLAQHMTAAPPPLSEVLSGTRSEVDMVLLKALEKDPARRFPSCAAFVAALGKAYGLSMTAPTAMYPPPEFDDRTDAINVKEASHAGPPATEIMPQAPTGPPPLPERRSAVPTRSMPEERAKERPGLTAPPSVVDPGSRGGKRWVPFAAIAALMALGAIGWLVLRNRAPQEQSAENSQVTVQPTEVPPPPTAAVANVEPTQPAATTSASTETNVPPTPAVLPPTAVPPRAERREPEPKPKANRDEREAERRDTEPRKGDGYGREEREDVGGPAPRGEAMLHGSSLSADTTLSSAWESLNPTRKRNGKLEREDFVSAMGDARRAMSRRDTEEVRFLDTYARAGVAFADGRTTDAWQLLRDALGLAPSEVRRTKKARLVGSQLTALGPQPGPDGGWIMGLAFADVRGDLDEELQKAEERAPENARIAWARALHAADQGLGKQARRWARKACQGGIQDACGY